MWKESGEDAAWKSTGPPADRIYRYIDMYIHNYIYIYIDIYIYILYYCSPRIWFPAFWGIILNITGTAFGWNFPVKTFRVLVFDRAGPPDQRWLSEDTPKRDLVTRNQTQGRKCLSLVSQLPTSLLVSQLPWFQTSRKAPAEVQWELVLDLDALSVAAKKWSEKIGDESVRPLPSWHAPRSMTLVSARRVWSMFFLLKVTTKKSGCEKHLEVRLKDKAGSGTPRSLARKVVVITW